MFSAYFLLSLHLFVCRQDPTLVAILTGKLLSVSLDGITSGNWPVFSRL